MTRTFNLADLFEIVAGVVPERKAVVCADFSMSFRELDQRATRLGSALRKHGIQRGDHVGIQLANSPEYLETFLACCKIGAVPININYRYVADELHYLFKSLNMKTLVYGAEFSEEVQKAAGQAPRPERYIMVGDYEGDSLPDVFDYEMLLASGSADLADPDRSENDLYILCTGGTTGMPKGVVWTHKSIFMAALGGGGIYFGRPPIATPEELTEFVPHGPALSYFVAAPLMHGAAIWASLISLLSGHTLVLNDQPSFNAEHIWDLVERHQVNILSIVGDAMATPLIQALEATPNRWNLSHMAIFGNGGAALSPHLQERLLACLPNLRIANGMGSSESGMIGGTAAKIVDGPGLIRIEPRPDIAVIDENKQIVTTPGTQGILSRTGYTPIGYYGDPVKSAETFVTIDDKVWVLTGDHARIDETGDIIVLGRGSQCINTGGEKVFPEEVEAAARRYPAVQDILVVGLDDPRWGQKVAAVIEVKPGADFCPEAFQLSCREHLSGYKIPRAIFLADMIMRSPAGKANYRWAKHYASSNTSLI